MHLDPSLPDKLQNKDARIVLEELRREFIGDFLLKKLGNDQSGWRSISEILRNVKISKYSLYGRSEGTKGPVLQELLSSREIETRMFAGERGRGGEIMKLRVAQRRIVHPRLKDGPETV